jgi:hypothetical protein
MDLERIRDTGGTMEEQSAEAVEERRVLMHGHNLGALMTYYFFPSLENPERLSQESPRRGMEEHIGKRLRKGQTPLRPRTDDVDPREVRPEELECVPEGAAPSGRERTIA